MVKLESDKNFQISIQKFPIPNRDQRLYPDETSEGDNIPEEEADLVWCIHTDKDGVKSYRQIPEGVWDDIIFGDKPQIHEDEIDEAPCIAIGKVGGVTFMRRKKLNISNLDGDDIEVIEEKATLFMLMQVDNKLLLRPYSRSQMVLLQELPMLDLDIKQIEKLVEDPYGGIDAKQIMNAKKRKASRRVRNQVIFSSNS